LPCVETNLRQPLLQLKAIKGKVYDCYVLLLMA